MNHITGVYLFVSVDPNGNEGIMFMKRPEGQMPLMAANRALFLKLLPIAQEAAKKKGRIVKIVRLDHRVDYGRIGIDGSVRFFEEGET